MGRRYDLELERLGHTVAWALTQDSSPLEDALRELGQRSLVAVGSGGSYVAASLAARLHESTFGRLARAITPLEAATEPIPMDAGALLLSARGTNADILQARRSLASRGLPAVALCARTGAPLVRQARTDGHFAVDFDVPGGRDGYLATNSLIATLVLLSQAFSAVAASPNFAAGWQLGDSYREWLDWEAATAVARHDTVLVLTEGWGTPAATDIESRFSEAALAHVLVTDFRNFAHGRHLWLDKRADTTAVVSLETPSSRRVADAVFRLLPPEVSTLRVTSENEGPSGAIELVAKTMALTWAAAEPRGLDPGRPTVASFGRRLYRAGFPVTRRPFTDRWVALKAEAQGLGPEADREFIRESLQRYLERLDATVLRALVLDYDGTLSSVPDRFSPLDGEVAQELARLLKMGMVIGIATGRGDSAVKEMRKAIPREYWDSIVIGLYNGDAIGTLADPPGKLEPTKSILELCNKLRPLTEHAAISVRVQHRQLTIETKPTTDLCAFAVAVDDLIRNARIPARVAQSSHSVDVILGNGSKLAVVERLAEELRVSPEDDSILRIGDRGGYLGNDAPLLRSGLSLSVDEVSSDLETCWNLSPGAKRGHRATLAYLRAIGKTADGLRLSTRALHRAR